VLHTHGWQEPVDESAHPHPRQSVPLAASPQTAEPLFAYVGTERRQHVQCWLAPRNRQSSPQSQSLATGSAVAFALICLTGGPHRTHLRHRFFSLSSGERHCASEQRATLRGWLSAGKTEQRMAFRAEVILAIAEGLSKQGGGGATGHAPGDGQQVAGPFCANGFLGSARRAAQRQASAVPGRA
jgi:hypothetical protein